MGNGGVEQGSMGLGGVGHKTALTIHAYVEKEPRRLCHRHARRAECSSARPTVHEIETYHYRLSGPGGEALQRSSVTR